MSEPMDVDQLSADLIEVGKKADATNKAFAAFMRIKAEVLRARKMEAHWRSMVEGVRALVEEEEPK